MLFHKRILRQFLRRPNYKDLGNTSNLLIISICWRLFGYYDLKWSTEIGGCTYTWVGTVPLLSLFYWLIQWEIVDTEFSFHKAPVAKQTEGRWWVWPAFSCSLPPRCGHCPAPQHLWQWAALQSCFISKVFLWRLCWGTAATPARLDRGGNASSPVKIWRPLWTITTACAHRSSHPRQIWNIW